MANALKEETISRHALIGQIKFKKMILEKKYGKEIRHMWSNEWKQKRWPHGRQIN